MNPEQEFIWFGEKHAKALETLKYGMQEEKGFVLLTGKKGTGKTLILDTFFRKFSQNNLTVSISEPVSDYLDFANILSREFNLNKTFL